RWQYRGEFETGLYPGGANEPPEAHRRAGERLARAIRPLDAAGRPGEANGRIVLLALGHSNGRYYFGALEDKLREHAAELHPRFTFINAAVPGGGIARRKNWESEPVRSASWQRATELLARPGFSPAQVQVLWLIASDVPAHPKSLRPETFPGKARELQQTLQLVIERCAREFPNLKLAFVMSEGLRHFSGVEPQVFEEGFAVKWLIERQINGAADTAFEGAQRRLPWLAWGPYFWDNTWDATYFLDGTHAAPKARAVFVSKAWQLLSTGSVTRPWFLNSNPKTKP
ncbi:MAG: hypothetical protein L0Z50_07860, partial [Verrucomicrobiales bacterium]|nr:hypothetical protein [Verrucomicrobiales bacterium]